MPDQLSLEMGRAPSCFGSLLLALPKVYVKKILDICRDHVQLALLATYAGSAVLGMGQAPFCFGSLLLALPKKSAIA